MPGPIPLNWLTYPDELVDLLDSTDYNGNFLVLTYPTQLTRLISPLTTRIYILVHSEGFPTRLDNDVGTWQTRGRKMSDNAFVSFYIPVYILVSMIPIAIEMRRFKF